MLRAVPLRELALRTPPANGRARHISAASGLVCVGDFLYVVADDELHLGVFRITGEEPGELLRLRPGVLPTPLAARKAAKPDFETLALLPPHDGRPHGALLALGSGSRPNRCTGIVLTLDASGATTGSATAVDLAPAMARMSREVGELNIEGAVVRHETVRLLQRGNRGGGLNAVITMRLADLLLPADGFDLAVRPVDLGSVRGVPLTFTDGAGLPDGSMAFTAVAENTPDSYADGPCLGAAVGVLGPDGRVRMVEPVGLPLKIEGVWAAVAGDAVQLLLVTDPDDPAVPAVLYAAEAPGYPFGAPLP